MKSYVVVYSGFVPDSFRPISGRIVGGYKYAATTLTKSHARALVLRLIRCGAKEATVFSSSDRWRERPVFYQSSAKPESRMNTIRTRLPKWLRWK